MSMARSLVVSADITCAGQCDNVWTSYEEKETDVIGLGPCQGYMWHIILDR